MSTAFLAISFTAAGGLAEVNGFVKLSRELRRARGGEEGALVAPASGSGDTRSSHGGQVGVINPAVETDEALGISAVIVNSVPAVGDTADSRFEHLDARVENLEILRAVAERDRQATDARAAQDLSEKFDLTEAQIQAIEKKWQADRIAAQSADQAEANARAWFIAGIVLATVGGIAGSLAT